MIKYKRSRKYKPNKISLERFMFLLEQQELSLKEVSKLMDMKVYTLYEIAFGIRSIEYNKIVKLAQVLNCSIDYIAGDQGMVC